MTASPDLRTFPLGLEEGPGGATLVHSLSVPGCVAGGATQEEALAAFPRALAAWLRTLRSAGEHVPPPDAELDLTVDEWVTTDADVAAGESTACFEADLVPLTPASAARDLRRLGDLRGILLRDVKGRQEPDLDRGWGGEWTARRALEELARAQWWTLSRLGSSPLAELPDRTLGRLDTAMALVVHSFSEMSPEAMAGVVDLDGETWTPRKVLRRLLWLEWTLGRLARAALLEPTERP